MVATANPVDDELEFFAIQRLAVEPSKYVDAPSVIDRNAFSILNVVLQNALAKLDELIER